MNRKEAQRPIGLCPRPTSRVTAMSVAAARIGRAKLRQSAMSVEQGRPGYREQVAGQHNTNHKPWSASAHRVTNDPLHAVDCGGLRAYPTTSPLPLAGEGPGVRADEITTTFFQVDPDARLPSP